MRGRRGFTLIELLIVVAIIGIIAAVAIPSLKEAREAADRAQARQAEAGPERLRLDRPGRIEIWCDTLDGTRLYRVVGQGGIIAVPGGCK